MLIQYGIKNNNIDVTDICYNKLCINNVINIPQTDFSRANLFGDPLSGILKSIFITNDLGETIEYDHKKDIYINTLTNTITVIDEEEIENKLKKIHSHLYLDFGSLNDEYPEQIMAVKYLTGYEKVLEIGGNIGRNSLVIASILKEKNNHQFVSLESSKDIANQLRHNRDRNDFQFYVENSALSKRKLIQRGWDTIESDVLLDGYQPVNTITMDELYSKYNIEFDTLVLDCEGAFYYILMDMPEILQNIHLIIMENDYWDINKKNYVDNVLVVSGFYRDYVKSGGWGPCLNNFFEVWRKK
jgi:FkbM family methyltransferase